MELNEIYFAVKREYNVDFLIDCRETLYKEARIIFTKIAFDNDYNRYEIADYIKRKRCVTYNSLKRFDEYFSTEKSFKRRYEKILEYLNENIFKSENEKEKRREYLIKQLQEL